MKYKALISVVLGFFLFKLPSVALAACVTEVREETYYYGLASCVSTNSIIGRWPIEEYFTDSPIKRLLLHYDFGGPQLAVCAAEIPHTGTRIIETEVCDYRNPVAIADVNDNDMDIYDSTCNWGGWSGHTMGRSNNLFCGGKQVVTVTQLTGQPGKGNCSTNFTTSGYYRRSPGTTDCYIPIYRK